VVIKATIYIKQHAIILELLMVGGRGGEDAEISGCSIGI
jgi:hypothetical protein